MKYGLVSAVLLFCSCHFLFSQISAPPGEPWFEYPFDQILTITIPVRCQITDTLGVKKVTAETEHGFIMLSAVPINSRMRVQSEQALLKGYASFQSGFVNSQRGELVESKMVRIGSLTGSLFLFRTTDGTDEVLSHCLCLFIDGSMYIVTFSELAPATEEAAADRDRLFASIQLPADLSFQNQTTSGRPEAVPGGLDPGAYRAGQILGAVLILLVLLFVAVRIWGRPWNRPDPAQ